MKQFNLKFEYLHRDEGNYKIFGEIIILNPENVPRVKAAEILRHKLIDGEYFYPEEAQIPLFPEHNSIGIYFEDWYEFSRFSETEEDPTIAISFEEFIRGFKSEAST